MKDYPVGLSVEEGRKRIEEAFPIMETEEILLQDACGRVLACDVVAKCNVPPYSRSPYDGYAFRADDLANASKENPVTLQIIEEVPAGHVASRSVEAGQAIKILTGAPMPKGADTIEKFEVTEFTSEEVTFFSPVKKGSNVVPEGEDIRLGEQLLSRGSEITPGAWGILASLGLEKVLVYRELSVALISTGDELLGVGEKLTQGKLYNSSAYTLAGYLKDWGMQVSLFGIVEDDVEKISSLVREAAKEHDLVITTGGVSVGDYDCMQRVMEHIGAEVLYWKTKMKPGSAFLAATYEGEVKKTGILCLSGNPSAAAVALMLIGKPVLRKMAGYTEYSLQTISVKLDQEFKKKSPMRRFIPAKLCMKDGVSYAITSSKSGNGMVSPLDGVNLLVEVDAGSDELGCGESFLAYLI